MVDAINLVGEDIADPPRLLDSRGAYELEALEVVETEVLSSYAEAVGASLQTTDGEGLVVVSDTADVLAQLSGPCATILLILHNEVGKGLVGLSLEGERLTSLDDELWSEQPMARW